MPMINALSAKDKNAPVASPADNAAGKPDMKSMEYHRQVLASKMQDEGDAKDYVSPSDNIKSPCTAKLDAFKSRQASKAKPKSLFAQASAKKFDQQNNNNGSIFVAASTKDAATSSLAKTASSVDSASSSPVQNKSADAA